MNNAREEYNTNVIMTYSGIGGFCFGVMSGVACLPFLPFCPLAAPFLARCCVCEILIL